jgi:hypothetical protein
MNFSFEEMIKGKLFDILETGRCFFDLAGLGLRFTETLIASAGLWKVNKASFARTSSPTLSEKAGFYTASEGLCAIGTFSETSGKPLIAIGTFSGTSGKPLHSI